MARPELPCKCDMPRSPRSHLHSPARRGTERSSWDAPASSILVDDLDGAILREMILGDPGFFRAERVSLERIADALGVHRNTVALRVQRMTKAHVFLPLSVTVDPSQFGLQRGTLWIVPSPDRRSELGLSSLWLVEGVQLVVQYVEGWLVFVYGEDEAVLEARRRLVVHLLEATRSEWQSLSGRDYVEHPPLPLGKLDVTLIRLLMVNARTPFVEVAREAGTSVRTVQRRFRSLTSSGAVMVLPSGVGHASGLVLGHVRVWLRDDATPRDRILGSMDAMLSRAIFRNLRHPRVASWVLAVPTLTDVESMAARLRKLPSVSRTDVRILLDFRLNPQWPPWLLRWLERRGGKSPRHGSLRGPAH